MDIQKNKKIKHQIFEIVLIGAGYYLTGKLGLILAIPPGVATLVWPPSGIALAGVLLFGYHVWPGIVLASLLLNVPVLFPHADINTLTNALIISLGSLFQALLGGYLISTIIKRNQILDRVKNILLFILIEFFVCLIAPTVAIASLTLTHVIAPEHFFKEWITWWMGDFTGVIVLTPFMMAWSKPSRLDKKLLIRIPEVILFGIFFIVVTEMIFGFGQIIYHYPWLYPYIPFIIWSTFRLGHRGVTTTLLMVASMSVLGTLMGLGPFSGQEHNDFFQLYPFIMISTITGLFLGAASSEQKRVEGAIRNSEARLKVAMRAGRMGAWEWDIKSNRVIWSRELEEIHQLKPGSFGGTFEAFKADIHPEDQKQVMHKILLTLDRKAEHYFTEYRIIKPDSSTAWLEARGSLVLDSSGKPECMLGICMDISERKKAEELNLYFTALVESTEDAVFGKTLDGTITSWNKAAERMFGYRQEEMVGQSVFKLCPAERTAEERNIIDQLKKGRSIQHFETVRMDQHGNPFFVSLTVSPIRDRSDKIIGASSVCRNIADRKKAERALLMSHADLEKKVLDRTRELVEVNITLKKEMEERFKAQREILVVREKEQKRIGQDLHDGLAQKLAGLSFITKTIQQKLERKSIHEASEMSIILEHIRMAIDETKSLARGFYPIELERLGLFSALKELAINTQKLFNVSCEHYFDQSILIQNEEIATNIYRIIQETIHNAIKHGTAKKIFISIKKEDGHIIVGVKDNGKGISDSVKGGMGFKTMHHRAKLLGGDLQIANNPEGEGVFVSFQFPASFNSTQNENQFEVKTVEIL